MKKTILIVDDDPITIHLLKLILEPAGFATKTAQNGLEAVEIVKSDAPDAVLLDVMMPIMDGFAVCEKIRAKAETSSLPIIILSTNAQAHSVEKGIQAGASKYLFKPISRDSLISEITRAVETDQQIPLA